MNLIAVDRLAVGNMASGAPPPIECRQLWRIFGANADRALTDIRSQGLTRKEAEDHFGCVIAVADVSFTVEKGEIFCIMGLSGSGKSTLLRHINRLIEPNAGTVLIDGQDIAGLGPKPLEALRSKTIGMVFQHMALWPHRTVRDNVSFGLEVRGVDRRTRYKAADRALEQVKLTGWETRYPDELSGGMQQRVGLARALAADPEILLMDEPFSALDPLIRKELQAQFLELAARVRKTTVFVTHDLEEAVRLGNRIAIMKDGIFVQVGTPEEILLNPKSEYVEAFVQGMSKLPLLTAEHVMQPMSPHSKPLVDDPATAIWVDPRTGFRKLVELATATEQPLLVGSAGRAVGVITRQCLFRAVQRDLGAETADGQGGPNSEG
jgi:glycine betaine/proline transport system ATP-binding protein